MSLPKCAFTKEFNLFLFTWVVLSTFTFVYSHVSLTFPRARKYDFDFLDNGRTKGPCGMPKGTETTALPAGVQFNVTWHLAYPHRGGFRLELLDPNERLLLNLTQSNLTHYWIKDGDVTAQSYPVTLPKTLTCRGCTIRLLRQASEWGDKYTFWSCADVDIIPVTSIITSKNAVCSGNGKFNITDGKCHCNRFYSGIVCQFLDECWTDDDCGNHGKCIRINTTYPTRQCYCKVGWFGEKCSKESTIKSTEVDLKNHFHRQLTQGYDLYWRIIKESEEIEIVLKVLGNGYASVGWRPQDISSSCKAFPYIIDTNVPVVNIDPRNSLPPSANSANYETRRADNLPNESAPTFKKIKVSSPGMLNSGTRILPDGRLTNSSGSRQPKSSDNILGTVSSISTTSTGHAVPESAVTVSTSEPSSSSASSEPEPVPEAEASPEPKSVPSDDSSNLKSETEPESKVEPKSEPEIASTSKPEPSSEPEPKNEPEPSSIAVESQTVPSFAEPEVKPTERDAKSIESIPEPESEVKPTVEPATSEVEPVKIEAKPESEPIDEPAPEAEPKVKPEPEPESEPKVDKSDSVSVKPEEEPKPETSSSTDKSQFHPGSFAPVDLDSPIRIRSKRQSDSDVSVGSFANVGAAPASKRRATDGWTKSDYPPVTDYTPKFDFHPMDCNDIVIGSAIGEYGRVLDYYTRDRSTPRVDSLFGGKNDLTGATAFESDGLTTIIFRKKLIADELTDHSILNKTMDVIWAKGQEHKKYVHSPPSGLEEGKAKNPNFYGSDEIKYHGHGGQRGKLQINFYEEPMVNVTPKSAVILNSTDSENSTIDVNGTSIESLPCNGEYRYPKDCKSRKCDYIFTWKYNEDFDGIDFGVSAKRIDKWTGIGFSKNKLMPNTDVVIAWVEPGGRYLMMDAWIDGYSQPKPDTRQSIFNISALNENGLITFKFSRKINTLDTRHDLSLNDCVHFVYPVSGGPVDSSRKNIRKHLQAPLISDSNICFGKCRPAESTPEPNVNKPIVKPEPGVSSKPEPSPEPKPEPKPESEPTKPKPEPESPVSEPDPKAEPKPEPELKADSKPEPSAEPKPEPEAEPENKIDTRYGTVCSGEWKYPSNCTGYSCDYQISWEYMDDNDDIMFNLQTKNTNRWTGIGFSNNKLMPQTDVILGLVEESGRFFLMDTWLNDYNTPPLDKKQDIHNSSAWRENGITHLKFHRYRKTNDPKDFEFSDNACPYFVFPIRGGVFNAVNKRIRKHEAVPIISEDRVCVKSCKPKLPSSPPPPPPPPPSPIPVSSSPKPEPEPEAEAKPEPKPPLIETEPKPEVSQSEKPVESKPPQVDKTTQPAESSSPLPSSSTTSTTTSAPPDQSFTTIKSTDNEIADETMVVLEIKMPNAWKSSLGQRNSADYRKLMTKLEDQLEKELVDNGQVPKQIEVTDISGVGENGVLATVKVEIANTTESRARSDKPIVSIREALNETIKDGKVGNLIVDPSYLIFKSPDIIDVSNESNDTKKAGLSSEQLTYLAIIVGLSSLVILCISQALCMVWRDKSNKEKKMKEKAMVNSHYKDYSATTTSSAYSYENFAVQDDPDGVGYKPMNGGSGIGGGGGGGKSNGNLKSDLGNGKKKGSKGSTNGLSNYNSATVDRSDSKTTSTFGYPSAYATHDRKDNNTFRYISQPQPLTPDFYFMPHQRRYSGEVVRVFVDYNNPQFMPK